MKEMQLQDDFVYNNEEEAEMGQLHAIHNNMNAVAAVRRELEKQAQQPSAEECEECGDEIPLARRLAIPGVQLCVFCKERQERH
jgi:phage/conjugal plasmid C-4 type zinc finger TraR family protein